MTELLVFCWRNLWRKRRRTLLTAGSMAAAVMLAVYFLALADGMYGRLLHQVLRMQGGQLTVEHARYLESPSVDLVVDRTSELRRLIAALPDVSDTKVLVLADGVASSADGSVGTEIMGVEPSIEAKLSPLTRRLVAGSFLEDGDDRACVIGSEMARRLKLEIGSKLVVAGNDVRGQLVQEMLRVRGVFRTGAVELDGHVLLVPLRFARGLAGLSSDQVTQIGILLRDPGRQDAVERRVRHLLTRDQRVAVWPWQAVLPELSSFMQVDKGSNYVFQIIILLLAMFTIFNTVLMSALERKREFAVMLALGTPPARVQLQLLLEATLLGLFGAGVGVLLGCTLALGTDGISLAKTLGDGLEVGGFLIDPVLHVKPTARMTVGVGGGAVLAVALMSLVPMSRIRKIKVTDAFR